MHRLEDAITASPHDAENRVAVYRVGSGISVDYHRCLWPVFRRDAQTVGKIRNLTKPPPGVSSSSIFKNGSWQKPVGRVCRSRRRGRCGSRKNREEPRTGKRMWLNGSPCFLLELGPLPGLSHFFKRMLISAINFVILFNIGSSETVVLWPNGCMSELQWWCCLFNLPTGCLIMVRPVGWRGTSCLGVTRCSARGGN